MTSENFCSPPEAPVFYPTCDEFSDPLEYIEKIRPIASRAGLCKIIPPKEWQPPFCVNVDEFRFTPRVQRINELEAGTRAKIRFYERLTKLFESQGLKLKIPTVEKEILDLARLHKIVKEEGGYDLCCSQKKWSTVARKMNFHDMQTTNRVLKQHYEKILLTYDVYETGIYEEQTNLSNDDESKKTVEANGTVKNGNKTKDRSPSPVSSNSDPFANFICKSCARGDDDSYLLICDICDNCYHTYCLIPALIEIPRGQWRCPKCVAKLYRTASPSDAYGFEQSEREYTLGEFGEMADEFKRNYFKRPLKEISCDEVEQEFWRILSLPDAFVKVEYGADIPTGELGSGFPTMKTKDLTENDKKYLNSPWNLNNFACHYKSVLRYINADISGMKVPWAYVGMCFSCFCWHVEDHWSYSINYLHWGEAKTWYGVPGSGAEKLESCMKSYAPELFSTTPDLLHHLVTTMNPSILLRDGVPITKTNQYAGEFVITFPRAYHAGFNHGFNFAEANNFCPADWLPMGRCAIDHYKEVKRYSVFSHDELICKLASECQYLDPAIGDATKFELDYIVKQEKKNRKIAHEKGAADNDRVCFELMPDDERQCDACKTTCFLSAISCLCKPNILVCLNHVDQLCSCSPRKYSLWYRYTIDEMTNMLDALRERLDLCQKWKILVNRLISSDHQTPIDFDDIEKHTTSGVLCLRDDIRIKMEEKLAEAIDCRQMAKNILKQVMRKNEPLDHEITDELNKKKKISGDETKVTLNDINQLKTRVKSIGIIFNEMNMIQNILTECLRYQDEIKTLLQSEKLHPPDTYSSYIERNCQYNIDLPIIERLKLFYQASLWYEIVEKTLNKTIPTSKLRSLITSGQAFQALHQQIQQKLNELQMQLQQLESWDEKCRQLTKEEPRPTLNTLEEFIKSADDANIHLNSIDKIKNLIIECRLWNEKFEHLQQGDHYPFLSSYEQLYEEARHFHMDLEPLKYIEQTILQARSWLEKAQSIFRRTDSNLTLIEMITPRISVAPKPLTKKRQASKRTTSDGPINESIGVLDETIAKVLLSDENNPETVYKIYRAATVKEIECLIELREHNQKKRSDPSSTYCICEKPYSDIMVQCDLCNEYYHRNCLPYHGSDVNTSIWWLCDFCIRSKRPRLQDVLKLLASLQKLTVRLPEGEILQCLTERAIGWQEKAEAFLASPILRELSTVKQENKNIKDEFINDPNRQRSRSSESETCRPLNNLAESQLENILIEGGLLEIYVDQIKLLTKLINSSRRTNVLSEKPKAARLQIDKTKSATTIRKRKSYDVPSKPDKTIRRKRSRKSFVNDQRSSDSQSISSAPVVYVSSMTDIQQSLVKSSPKSDFDHDNNAVLISDDDHDQNKKGTIFGTGEDECAVDGGACLKPSGSSIKWVCCDACERWFHLVCVGLTSVKRKEEYKCTRCKQLSLSTVSSSSSTPIASHS